MWRRCSAGCSRGSAWGSSPPAGQALPLMTSVAERLGLGVAAAAEFHLPRDLGGRWHELRALIVANDDRSLDDHGPSWLPGNRHRRGLIAHAVWMPRAASSAAGNSDTAARR